MVDLINDRADIEAWENYWNSTINYNGISPLLNPFYFKQWVNVSYPLLCLAPWLNYSFLLLSVWCISSMEDLCCRATYQCDVWPFNDRKTDHLWKGGGIWSKMDLPLSYNCNIGFRNFFKYPQKLKRHLFLFLWCMLTTFYSSLCAVSMTGQTVFLLVSKSYVLQR